MYWVLVPSHCITSPRTIRSLFKNALYFYYLHCIFRVLFRSFPFYFGNNKALWRLLLLWYELINNLISDLPRYIFYRYKRQGNLFSPKPQSGDYHLLPNSDDWKEISIRHAEENRRLKAQISRLTGKRQCLEWSPSALLLKILYFIFILYFGLLKLVVHFEVIIIKKFQYFKCVITLIFAICP